EAGLRVAGTALALPGLVNRVTGPLRYAPNLGWRDVDVVRLMSRHPVLAAFPPSLANEANVAARAEAWARRGRVAPSFFYVSGELGIGGAIVLEGEIFAGRHGWSGEIGHVVVEPALGAERGGLEALAGQALMLRAAGMPVGATIADLAAAAERGEAQPLAAVRDAGRMLGTALAAAANILDIGEVVLGGSFGQLFDHLHREVEACLQQMVIFAPWSTPAVTRARAGELPAMAGGALTVLRGVVDDAEAWVA
ncbi:MAG: ROK family protein, partial [Cellulomonas sp.]|nr:ROK family protein [Cellulomonas sp.]